MAADKKTNRLNPISAHPMDVKRGTFLSEMSRMAILNSTRLGYETSIKTLCLLYIGRGYPVQWIKHLAKTQLEQRWLNRLREPQERAHGVLVLKSEFNPIWEPFNSHELMSIIREKWIKNHLLIQWCDEPHCEHLAHFGGINRSARLKKLSRTRRDLDDAVARNNDEANRSFGADTLEAVGRRVRIRTGPSGATVFARGSATVGGLAPLWGEVHAGLPDAAIEADDLLVQLNQLLKPVYCTGSEPSPQKLPQPGGALSYRVVWKDGGGSVEFVDPNTGDMVSVQRPPSLAREPMFDVHKSTFNDFKLLVSRKKGTQLGNLFTKWRHDVLLDYQMVMDITPDELAF